MFFIEHSSFKHVTFDVVEKLMLNIFSESRHRVELGTESWNLALDQDLIDTIKNNFPLWFAGNSLIKSTKVVATKNTR